MTVENFLRSRAPLSTGHAVAALLVLEDGRYIMQLRDDLPNIWYPGHWGLFGGGIDEGEDEFTALQRELREELELEVTEARLFATIDYDLQPIGLDRYSRKYYEVPRHFDRVEPRGAARGKRGPRVKGRRGVIAPSNIAV